MDYKGHTIGGHKKYAIFFADSFFDPMNDLDTERKFVDLHMFDGSSMCRKAQNILKVFYPMLSCIDVAEHT